jgi:protein arginine kinase
VTIDELVKNQGIWNSTETCNADIVLKSSVKLSRNIEGFLFPHKLKRKDREAVNGFILEKLSRNRYCAEHTVYNLKKCPDIDRQILIERNILYDDIDNEAVVVLSHDESFYFLLNAYDHIQLSAIVPGYSFDWNHDFTKKIMQELGKVIRFEYSSHFGYLTAYANKSGTGMELSITMHPAGMVYSGRMNELISDLNKKGLGLRGSWIDGYYEIYNKNSNGKSETELLEYAHSCFQDIINRERAVREALYSSDKRAVEDRVWRSYGILLSCRLLSVYEALDLLSQLRFGLSLGIIDYLTFKDINLLLFYIQDHHLKKRYGTMKNRGIEEVRATFIRDYLKEVL